VLFRSGRGHGPQGPMTDFYDPELLQAITVLKLALLGD